MFTKKMKKRDAVCSGFFGFAAVAVIFGILTFTLGSCGQGADEGPKKAATPVAYPPGGSYSSTQNVMLVSATDGAIIYYTTNGNTPTTSSAMYTSPITVSANTLLRAVAVKDGMENSEVMTENYSVASAAEKAASPLAVPPAGTYSGNQLVTLSSATEGAVIYYTTDGSTPTVNSTLYSGTIAVSSATTNLRAVAVKEGMNNSDIMTAIYNITNPVITINTQPVATTSVTQGSINGSLFVAASVSPAGPSISYQWYSNTANSNVGGNVISGATNASYTIPITLTEGTYYYFCEVSANEATPVRSAVATVNSLIPVITMDTQPVAAISVTHGSISGSLSVEASVSPAGPPLSYQWYSNTTDSNVGGTAVNGATGTSFAIPPNLAVGTFYYFCEARATAAASVRSNVTVLTVTTAPVIAIDTQPASTTNFAQGYISGSLSVAASVTLGGVPGYQWYSNTANSNIGGTVISGATGANYAIPTSLTAGTYYYFCEVTAFEAAALRSSVAAVNVAVPVITIDTQPTATTNVTYGSISGSLSVAASINPDWPALSYQWYSNTANSNTGGTVISGATNASYAIPTTLTAGTYYYFCEARATGAESVRSTVAAVNVVPVITIGTQPAATTNVAQGSISGSLSVAASVSPAGPPLSYQWYSNTTNSNTSGTIISGATGASYAIPTTLTAGTYYYFCEVRATGAVSVRSTVAAVNVVTPVISITTQPAATTNVVQGSINGSLSVTSSVSPTGPSLSYQWYSNTANSNVGGTAIGGATSASYAISTTLTAGTYYYFCEVRVNGATPVRSTVAAVNVVTVITITTHPAATTNVIQGNISGSLSVTASVSPTGPSISYQWYSNTTNSNVGGTVISGATSANYAIPTTLTAGTYYYFCEVRATGAVSVRSTVAVVKVVILSSLLDMATIPAGTFTMGSPTTEPHRYTNETQHQVTLSGFKMGKYQVTQDLYLMVTGTNPSYNSSSPVPGEEQGRRPVEYISWYKVLMFCNKLSIMEGLSPAYSISGSTDPAAWGTVPTSYNSTWDAAIVVSGSTGYRLPTEAQWEYACRAGTTTAYNTGASISDATGWYHDNSGNRSHEVGKKPANAWGLYDMHGNVYEWCWDWYGTYPSTAQTDPAGPSGGSNRVLRSGYWNAEALNLRSAYRNSSDPIYSYHNHGFRLVCP